MFIPVAISLDLDDTLWPIWPVIERAEQAMHQYLHSHCPRTAQAFPIQAMRALREQVAAEHPYLAHDFTEQRLICLRHALTHSGDDVTHAEPAFEALYSERNRVSFYPDAIDGLQRLAQHWPLAALTNGNADIQRIGIDQHFDHFVAARHVGQAKPHPAIFLHTCQLLGVTPTQLLHIGDDPQLDVLGAAAVGARTCWINRTANPWPVELGAPPDLEFSTLTALADWLEAANASTYRPVQSTG